MQMKQLTISKDIVIQTIISKINFNNGRLYKHYIKLNGRNILISKFINKDSFEFIQNKQDYILDHCNMFRDYSTVCRAIIETISQDIINNLQKFITIDGERYEVMYL